MTGVVALVAYSSLHKLPTCFGCQYACLTIVSTSLCSSSLSNDFRQLTFSNESDTY